MPMDKEIHSSKPAPAVAAKPKKVAPEANKPAEPKNAGKAGKENDAPKVQRAKSAYMFFCAEQRSAVKGAAKALFSLPSHKKSLTRRSVHAVQPSAR